MCSSIPAVNMDNAIPAPQTHGSKKKRGLKDCKSLHTEQGLCYEFVS